MNLIYPKTSILHLFWYRAGRYLCPAKPHNHAH